MRTCLYVVVLCSMALSAVAGELVTVESKDKTSQSIPLKFVVEKTKMSGEYFEVWGTVRNTSQSTYFYVFVTITLRRNGEFIGRAELNAQPQKIGPGQVAHLTQELIACEDRRPDTLEFMVSAELE